MPHAGCSIVAIVMRSKSGQCWEPEKETYSKSRTSGGSGITCLEHPPLNRPLGRKLRPTPKLLHVRPSQRLASRPEH